MFWLTVNAPYVPFASFVVAPVATVSIEYVILSP